MGVRMTFVTEEEGINVFVKSKEVNFELAVQNPVYRTGKEYLQIACLHKHWCPRVALGNTYTLTPLPGMMIALILYFKMGT